MLLIATTLFQSLLLRSLAVAQGLGVGGVALSARIDIQGVHWLPDTNYVVANEGPSGMDTVKVRVRSGGLAYASPYLDAMKLCLSGRNASTWIARWATEIKISLTGDLAQCWVFLANTGSGAVIIHDDKAFDNCDAFTLVRNNEGHLILSAKLDLKFLLEQITSASTRPPFIVVQRAYVRQHFAKILRSLNFVVPADIDDDVGNGKHDLPFSRLP